MLSLFPELFVLGNVAPTLLRVALAVVLISRIYPRGERPPAGGKKWLNIFYAADALLLIIGFLTQGAALLALAMTIFDRVRMSKDRGGEKKERPLDELTILVIASSLSLLILGPGIFAIDLPL
ncbi:MAG TPA: hypothetical protein VJJ73_02005 [Candidatus Paceibacterota bacterium]